MGSEPPNLQRNPNEQGVPPAHRKVRRESQEARRHRVKGPGYGQKPLAVDIMQPRVHSRALSVAFCDGGRSNACSATGGLARILRAGIRDTRATNGSRFNDSTGDGSLPPEWAQDRVS